MTDLLESTGGKKHKEKEKKGNFSPFHFLKVLDLLSKFMMGNFSYH